MSAQAAPQTGTAQARSRLVRASSVYFVAFTGLRLLGFAILVIYSRFMNPQELGIVSIAESASLGVGILAGLGLEAALLRLYFDFARDSNHLRRYLSSVLWTGTCSGLVMLAVCYLAGPMMLRQLAPDWPVAFFPYLALALFTAISSQLVSTGMVVFQCQERYLRYSSIAVLQSLATSAFTLLLVVWMRRGAMGLLAARACGVALPLMVVAAGSVPILRARPDWHKVALTLRVSLPLVANSLMATGLIVLDRFILMHFRPMIEVGLYSVAYTCGMGFTLLTNSIFRGWAPVFYSLGQEGKTGQRIGGRISAELMMTTSLLASGCAVLFPQLLHILFDRRYWPVAGIAPLLILAYLCHGWFMFSQMHLMQARRSGLVALASAAALACNLAFNFAWIPRFGATGAAYATLAAYAIEALLAAILAQRVHPLEWGWMRPGLALAICGLTLVWLRFTEPGALSVVLGGALLLVALLVFVMRRRDTAPGLLPEPAIACEPPMEG